MLPRGFRASSRASSPLSRHPPLIPSLERKGLTLHSTLAMIVPVIRFFQRYANFFATLAGVIAYRRLLPDDSPWWLQLPVGLAVWVLVYELLYKDEVTGIREGGKPGLTVLAIVGLSVSYWCMVAVVLFILTAGDCDSALHGLAADRCIDGQNRFLIISVWIAAMIYAFGLWAKIRARRPCSVSPRAAHSGVERPE